MENGLSFALKEPIPSGGNKLLPVVSAVTKMEEARCFWWGGWTDWAGKAPRGWLLMAVLMPRQMWC